LFFYPELKNKKGQLIEKALELYEEAQKRDNVEMI